MERSPQGYPQIAAFLDACDEFAMLRKFGRVRLRVLLNLQAEISHIESELDRLDREDDSSEMNFRLRSSEQCFDRHGQQKDLYRRLQSKLSEYGKKLGLVVDCK
ncbi:hypothetical protein BKA64DRAFT_674759 [Cadophora sp. MPI-SDFR-AT-0126]|nr:hypothetical protein BKA64DRAFT_674759 [Leotiomycetes sp. MPI-SDFR-AT-0126]